MLLRQPEGGAPGRPQGDLQRLHGGDARVLNDCPPEVTARPQALDPHEPRGLGLRRRFSLHRKNIERDDYYYQLLLLFRF